LPPYDLPLILLARLAVHKRFSGRGLGHASMSDALKIALRVADEVGCRCIVTDAFPGKTCWYARYGSIPLEKAAASGPQKMFLDVRTFRRALSFESSPTNRG
jgi:predicted N-acetyltransferase YhbS